MAGKLIRKTAVTTAKKSTKFDVSTAEKAASTIEKHGLAVWLCDHTKGLTAGKVIDKVVDRTTRSRELVFLDPNNEDYYDVAGLIQPSVLRTLLIGATHRYRVRIMQLPPEGCAPGWYLVPHVNPIVGFGNVAKNHGLPSGVKIRDLKIGTKVVVRWNDIPDTPAFLTSPPDSPMLLKGKPVERTVGLVYFHNGQWRHDSSVGLTQIVAVGGKFEADVSDWV